MSERRIAVNDDTVYAMAIAVARHQRSHNYCTCGSVIPPGHLFSIHVVRDALHAVTGYPSEGGADE